MRLIGTHTQEVAERIVEAFRRPETLPQALAPIFIHRKDDVPCRKWSWHNQLVTALCGTTDARGFRQWEEVGRKVKKGCHAVWILAPCVKTVREEKDNGEQAERRVLYGFRSVPVFAVEDTEGEPLPESDDRYSSWVQELPLLEVAKPGTSQSEPTPAARLRRWGTFRRELWARQSCLASRTFPPGRAR